MKAKSNSGASFAAKYEGSGVEGNEKLAARNALSKTPVPKKEGINSPMPRPAFPQADLRVYPIQYKGSLLRQRK